MFGVVFADQAQHVAEIGHVEHVADDDDALAAVSLGGVDRNQPDGLRHQVHQGGGEIGRLTSP